MGRAIIIALTLVVVHSDRGSQPGFKGSSHALTTPRWNRIGAANITGLLGRDGGRLQPVASAYERGGRVPNHAVAGGAAIGQRQVVVLGGDTEADDVGGEHPQGLLKQFLTRLVAVHHHKGG